MPSTRMLIDNDKRDGRNSWVRSCGLRELTLEFSG
jgi:hypothetical protein